MPSIFSYQPYITREVSRTLHFPTDAGGAALGTVLGALDDGYTYISLPDGATLPTDQPSEIAASIQPVVLGGAAKAALRAASPDVRLVEARVAAQLADPNALTPAILALGPALDTTHGPAAYAASVTAWGEAQIAGWGL